MKIIREIKSPEYVATAQKEVDSLVGQINTIVNKYLDQSKMPTPQKLANVGRAMSASHVMWAMHLAHILKEKAEQLE